MDPYRKLRELKNSEELRQPIEEVREPRDLPRQTETARHKEKQPHFRDI